MDMEHKAKMLRAASKMRLYLTMLGVKTDIDEDDAVVRVAVDQSNIISCTIRDPDDPEVETILIKGGIVDDQSVYNCEHIAELSDYIFFMRAHVHEHKTGAEKISRFVSLTAPE